ncbi:hypothetical protein [Larkinella soli]|uniref:hypothetical protein n=1 Tax=Larkinella soli TaxID=1770527 RepID=UPI000FFBA1F0|nr:hypothetical protein [Larkinella soli]
MRRIFKQFPLLWGLALLACNDPRPVDPGTDPQVGGPVKGYPTEAGKPIGAPSSKTIGPDGGTLTSADGKLTLTIPAGALSRETLISVQPSENKAPNGAGPAFRFAPEGTRLAKPALLSYRYERGEISGPVPGNLNLAAQAESGVWNLTRAAAADTTKQTVAAEVDELDPFAFIEKYKLSPEKLEVIPGEKRRLAIYYHPQGFFPPGGKGAERPLSEAVIAPQGIVQEVTINGLKAPNPNEWGTFWFAGQTRQSEFDFVAPSKVPVKSRNPLALGVRLYDPNGKMYFQLVSNAEVFPAGELTVDGKSYDDPVVVFMPIDNHSVHIQVTQRLAQVGTSAPSQVTASFNFYKGTGTYTLDGGNLGDYSVGATVEGKKGFYSNHYLEEKGGTVYVPVRVSITEVIKEGKKVSARGSITGTLYNGKKSDAIRVEAYFLVAFPQY